MQILLNQLAGSHNTSREKICIMMITRSEELLAVHADQEEKLGNGHWTPSSCPHRSGSSNSRS